MKAYSKKFGTVLLAYFLISIIFGVGASAQASSTQTKTLPKADTLDITMLGENVTIECLEVSKEFERIEITTKLPNQEQNATSKRLFTSGVFSVNVAHKDNGVQGTTTVVPNKQEIYITVQGQDVEFQRNYKVYANPTTIVKRNQKPSL